MAVRISVAPDQPPAGVYAVRHAVLRVPLGIHDAVPYDDDRDSIHAWVEVEAEGRTSGPADGPTSPVVVSVGRVRRYDPTTSSQPAVRLPEPLPDLPRPLAHVRFMATLPAHRRRGHAAAVLSALEQVAREHLEARTVYLRARLAAIPFYVAQGYEVLEPEYEIPGIGPHHSMAKRL